MLVVNAAIVPLVEQSWSPALPALTLFNLGKGMDVKCQVSMQTLEQGYSHCMGAVWRLTGLTQVIVVSLWGMGLRRTATAQQLEKG